jgi:hypothetical protein
MHDDNYDSNRVFGMSRGPRPHARQEELPQRVMGIPTDWFGPVDARITWALTHPVRAFRQWNQRRRLGPYAPDDDQAE